VGYGEGENRVTKAIQDALHSPLLKNTDVLTSKRILFNLYYSREANVKFKASEAKELNDFINRVEDEVDVIWGITYDETLGDKVKFTILASGFDVTINEKNDYRPNHISPKDEKPVDKDKISDFYGKEKVEQFEREKETQNYILLNADALDNDEMIENFAKSPTFTRDKRLSNNVVNNAPTDTITPKAPATDDSEGYITFGDDD
jgi:cell division protein FtsZ